MTLWCVALGTSTQGFCPAGRSRSLLDRRVRSKDNRSFLHFTVWCRCGLIWLKGMTKNGVTDLTNCEVEFIGDVEESLGHFWPDAIHHGLMFRPAANK